MRNRKLNLVPPKDSVLTPGEIERQGRRALLAAKVQLTNSELDKNLATPLSIARLRGMRAPFNPEKDQR